MNSWLMYGLESKVHAHALKKKLIFLEMKSRVKLFFWRIWWNGWDESKCVNLDIKEVSKSIWIWIFFLRSLLKKTCVPCIFWSFQGCKTFDFKYCCYISIGCVLILLKILMKETVLDDAEKLSVLFWNDQRGNEILKLWRLICVYGICPGIQI
jgi:hypothetical protein